MTKKKKKIKKIKINKKNIVKILGPSIIIIVFTYIIYKIINIIAIPTDMYMIENGTIYDEESAIRLCYKR